MNNKKADNSGERKMDKHVKKHFTEEEIKCLKTDEMMLDQIVVREMQSKVTRKSILLTRGIEVRH